MSRIERPVNTSVNPTKKFLSWKSDEKHFVYYDKELKENVIVPLPLKGIFIEHYHTVKGWHDATQKGIYSNEVFLSSKEPMNVRTFGGLEIAEGLYSEIKTTVNNAGASYHRSIYAMGTDGELFNISLKGASVGGIKAEKSKSKLEVDGYSEFYNKVGRLLDNQYFVIEKFAEAKSGKVEYSIPVFEIAKHITAKENDQCNILAKELELFVNNRKNGTAIEKIPVVDAEIVSEEELDDMPF